MRIAGRLRAVAGVALLALSVASCSLVLVPGPGADAPPDPASCQKTSGAPVLDLVAAGFLAYVGIRAAAGPIWEEDEIPIAHGTAAAVSLFGAAVYLASAETGSRRLKACRGASGGAR